MLKKMLKHSPHLYAVAQRFYPFTTALPSLLVGRRGSLDYMRSTWSLLWRSILVAGRPINITIEPTNICNLGCPVCETGNGELGRPDRQMTLTEFRTIIGKIGAHTNTLKFYFMGEPFLNSSSYEMIRVAKESGIPWVTTCTNGEVVDPEQLVMSGVDEVNFQIGGMSQETHQIYRINGNLERVMNNLRETIDLRRKNRTRLHIVCGMILMRHNESEVKIFRQIMDKIGVDEAVIVDPCVRTVAQGMRYLPRDERHWYYDPRSFSDGILRPRSIPKNSCQWIYYSMVIHSNGDIVPCCRDAKGEYVMGNILNQSLEDIWNNERYSAFRRELSNNQAQVSICRLCSGYPASVLR
jgi:radical SAM protein with 4Fe4S-binding SPASM domain